jgi:hypothetical protein
MYISSCNDASQVAENNAWKAVARRTSTRLLGNQQGAKRHVLAMERAAHPGGASRWMRIGSDGAERDGVAWPWKIV